MIKAMVLINYSEKRRKYTNSFIFKAIIQFLCIAKASYVLDLQLITDETKPETGSRYLCG